MKLSATSCLLVLSLCGCAGHAVRPSATADHVMAEQYRAQGEHGAISGSETAIIAEAYRDSIGKNTQTAPAGQTSARSAVDGNP